MNDFQSDELIAEDWPTYSTPIPVWILLAGLSAQAFKMYCFLAEHINANISDPRKRIACPKQKAIAVVLGLSSDRKVARYRRELERIGAIRVEEYRYAGGMRRGYRYIVRYNPPADYTGHMVLKQFYAAHPEVRSAAKWEGRTESAKAGETATVPPQSSASDDLGGHKRATDGAAAGAPARKKSAKGNVMVAPEVAQVLAAFPKELRTAMRETAHTDAPKTLLTEIGKQLQGRTAEQLVDRVTRRWGTHGYERKFQAGELSRPVGAAVAMLRHGECPDARCEDGKVLDTGVDCVLCIERGKDYKADRARLLKAEREATETARRRVMCPACKRDQGTNGTVCPACVETFERAIAEAADNAAADITTLPAASADQPVRARERVLEQAQQAREQARKDGATELGQLLAARLAAQSAAQEARQVLLSAVLPAQDPEAERPAPVEEREPVSCSGRNWDGSRCHRTTTAEDGLCGLCRGAQLARQQDQELTATN